MILQNCYTFHLMSSSTTFLYNPPYLYKTQIQIIFATYEIMIAVDMYIYLLKIYFINPHNRQAE